MEREFSACQRILKWLVVTHQQFKFLPKKSDKGRNTGFLFQILQNQYFNSDGSSSSSPKPLADSFTVLVVTPVTVDKNIDQAGNSATY
jgi:hypothetical protein